MTFEFERYFISVFFQRTRLRAAYCFRLSVERAVKNELKLLSSDDYGHAWWSDDVDRSKVCSSQSVNGYQQELDKN